MAACHTGLTIQSRSKILPPDTTEDYVCSNDEKDKIPQVVRHNTKPEHTEIENELEEIRKLKAV